MSKKDQDSKNNNDSPNLKPLLDALEEYSPRPLSIPEIARFAGIGKYDHRELKRALQAVAEEGRIRPIGKSRYQWVKPEWKTHQAPRRAGQKKGDAGRRVEGLYSRVRQGYGFVEVLTAGGEAPFGRDILIPEGMEGEAMHGDRVRVEIVRRDPKTNRTVGRITAVTGRTHEKIIGELEQRPRGWWLVPENELLPRVEITGGKQPRSDQAGLIGLVKLTRMPGRKEPPGGELIDVLGQADDPEVQFLTIALEHGLRIEFPEQALSEAASLPEDPPESEFEGREDLRELPFVTIDGETAKDFDDAVCLEELANGGYRLRVAIADVSHYVRPGSAIDDEACARGTSVYFPDRAVPMLPEALSNELCSLKPERPRLVQVAEMEYDRGGARQKSKFYQGVIRSHARLTYTQVAAMLSEADAPEIRELRERHEPLLPMLRNMHGLMRVLYGNRVRKGSLDLDLPEALVDLSEEGRSVAIRLAQRNDAHRIVEEFMLEANQAVAIHLQEAGVPFPYRVHAPPDEQAIDKLNSALDAFGYAVSYDAEIKPVHIQKLLEEMKGHPLSKILARLVLRSLSQAQYTIQNVGHFGLAFQNYCHFTSPIRRYPDLLVHRQMRRLYEGKREEAAGLEERMAQASLESSQREREAMQAERDMADLKKAEFMLNHLLEPEEGTIISVQPFGFFVELDAFPVEGLVKVDTLGDDYYEHVEEDHALVGRNSGRRFSLGDRVLIECQNVSMKRRQIDFTLLEHIAPAPTVGRARGRKKSRATRERRDIRTGGGRGPGKRVKPKKGSVRGKGQADKDEKKGKKSERKEKIKDSNKKRKKDKNKKK